MKTMLKNIRVWTLCMGAACFASAAIAALPVVSDVKMTQQGYRTVTITYRLSEAPGIVTLEILKDGEPIEGSLVREVTGDANKLIHPTSGDEVRTIKWSAYKDWPDQVFKTPTVSARVTAWATNTPPNVLVVDLESGAMNYYLDESYLPAEGGISNDVYRTSKMVMRRIPAGGVETTLGGFEDEYNWQFSDVRTKEVRHKVRFSKDYYMGVFEVTQAQWLKFRDDNPSSFKHPDCAATRPVESVWFSIVRGETKWAPQNKVAIKSDSFLGKLNALTGAAFDLPTECQWEFAAHGGTDEMFYNGRTYIAAPGGNDNTSPTLIALAEENLSKLGRWKMNGGIVDGMPETTWDGGKSDFSSYTDEYGTARVGSYLPNAYGLYDMLGNVNEICREAAVVSSGSPANAREWSKTDIVDPVSSWAYGSTSLDGIASVTDFNSGMLIKGGDFASAWSDCRPAAIAPFFFQWEGHRRAGFRVILELQ